MIPRLFFAVVICVCLTGCAKPNYVDYQTEALSVKNPDFSERFDTIVIIPRLGCNACTHSADKYYQKHKDDIGTLFVFTNLQSEKLLKIENGYDIADRHNVIIDKDNRHFSYDYEESNYSVILIGDSNGSYTFEYLLKGLRLQETDQ